MIAHSPEVKNEKNGSSEYTDQGHLLLETVKTEKVEPIDELEATFLNELEQPSVKDKEKYANPNEFVTSAGKGEEKSHPREGDPLTCNFCGRSFLALSDLKSHLLYHTGEKSFKCDQCGRLFAVKQSFQRHIRAHAGDRPYKCEKCGNRFVFKHELNQHLVRIHPDEDGLKAKNFTCGVCGEAFPLSTKLRVHERIHLDETPYQCEHCKLVFRQSYALTRHVCRVIEETKPFIGNVSDADASRGGSVPTHKSTSYSGNPFECEVCGKQFRQRSTLQEHARTHRVS